MGVVLNLPAEKQLKALMAEQRTKIEEIKKKTNYYSTKNLLDRYDDSPSRKVCTRLQPGAQVADFRMTSPAIHTRKRA